MSIRFYTICFMLFLTTAAVHAQLCQGSLGDPIVNLSFGNGSNPGGALSAAATTYQYVTADCPQDGYYAVRNNTSACFANSWHSLNADHTGNSGGYFMLVNASYVPGAFYLDTVRGLCGNTTYEFAAWIMNVLLPASCNGAGIQPNITFSIERTDGTLLQSYNTNNIGSSGAPTWRQYGFFFTTPATGSDIVLRIINNAPGGCGNDIALDDITFRPCGPQITGYIDGTAAAPVSFCEGMQQTYMLSCNLSGGFINPIFQWQIRTPSNPGWTDISLANSSSFAAVFSSATLSGVYQYRLAVAESGNMNSPQCRTYSLPFTFTVNANPVTTATNDGPVCNGNKIVLTATGGSQITWTGPNAFTGNGSPLTLANIQMIQAGKYYVTVTNTAGCRTPDSTVIIVNPSPVAATAFAVATICAGDSIQLSAGGGLAYQWIPATGLSNALINDPIARPLGTTQYQAIVSNQFSCKDTAATTINIMQKPVANAGPDRVILEGQYITLSASANGPGNYSWSPAVYIDDIHSLQPLVNPPSDIKYVLNVASGFGCGSSSDTMLVKVYKNIFIPNAFSPNGDGVNDTWNIPALASFPFFEVVIYGRWGELVFHAKNTFKPWDGIFKGKALQMGAYHYLIHTGIGQEVFKGSVMIIR